MTVGPLASRVIENVATILERSIQSTINAWLDRVGKEENLAAIPMSLEARAGHLHEVLAEVVVRLRSYRPLGSKELASPAAQHMELSAGCRSRRLR